MNKDNLIKKLQKNKKKLRTNKKKEKLKLKEKKITEYKNDVLCLYDKVEKALNNGKIYIIIINFYEREIASKFFKIFHYNWSDFPDIYYEYKITKRGLKRFLKEVNKIKRKGVIYARRKSIRNSKF